MMGPAQNCLLLSTPHRVWNVQARRAWELSQPSRLMHRLAYRTVWPLLVQYLEQPQA